MVVNYLFLAYTKGVLDNNRELSIVVCVMRVYKTVGVECASLPEKIKAARLKVRDKTMTELASAANMTTAYWYKIERGGCKDLPIATLEAIERALGVSFGVEV